MNLWTVFLTGLFTGGLTCLAVQGGLLAATIAQREEERLTQQAKKGGHALPILAFLLAKIVAYTLLGALLGFFGSFFQLSLSTRVFLQFLVVVFMVGTALNILNVHPIFRYFVIQPPRFLTRLIRKESKSKALFAPALLGSLTVFIPCGTTQAMMALAIVTGNPLLGAATMFAFTLGTSPVFFLIGYFATRLSGALERQFMRFAAFAIMLLAVYNLNAAVALTGSTWTLDSLWQSTYCTFSICDSSPLFASAATGAVSQTTISINSAGYTPNTFSVKAGSKVTLRLINDGGGGCAQAFTIPKLGIQKVVSIGSSDVVEFTAPQERGPLTFMCSMGMYRGVINVI